MTKLLYIGTEQDVSYLPYLKGVVGGASVTTTCKPIVMLTQVRLLCESKGFTGVITSSVDILKKLLNWTDNRKNPSLDTYQGSMFLKDGIEYLIINPLFHLVKVPYGKFIFERFISKLSNPTSWIPVTAFKWHLLDATNIAETFSRFESAFAISVDIETLKDPLSIRCIGYTAIFLEGDRWYTESCVLPIDSDWALSWMRRFNWELKAAKIFQNGKYDNAYLSMFNSVPYNWLWDTQHMFHCQYAELPKDLAFLNSFYVRESMYWKDLAETNDLMEYYRYNALDTWATANVWIAQMLTVPEYARRNYLMEFPIVYPSHMCEMIGIKRDMVALMEQRAKVDTQCQELQASIETMVGVPGFNTNSPKQMKALMKVFGLGDVESCDEKNLNKFALRHPLNSRIIKKILKMRKLRKERSTYLRTNDDADKDGEGGGKEFRGRILYSLNPHGTDTGRNASKESAFWCGLQIQNVPRGDSVKCTFVADTGFRLAECDLEQAESRDTAYAAGELALISAVESTRDFHSINASAFFGFPYEDIYDDVKRKTKNKELRDLSKRVNHGANYLMGWSVLIDTMGEEKIWQAKKLLSLPSNYGLRQVAEHLLSVFHKTYPRLSSTFYPWIVSQVDTFKMLVGPQGWTRYCFGSPSKNKLDLNAYVAHFPQSMNAMTLNKAFLRVFYEIALHPQYKMHFKLCAQIHDSILFQFREGHEYLVDMVRKIMEIPVTIKGADGITRTFTVPAAAKAGKDGKGAYRWSETE